MYNWIQGRIAAAYAALVVAVVIAIMVFFTVFLGAQQSNLAEVSLARQATLAADDLGARLTPVSSPSEIAAMASSLSQTSSARVTIFSVDGTLEGDSSDTAEPPVVGATTPDLQHAIQLGRSGAAGHGAIWTGDTLAVSVPIRDAGGFVGVVRLSEPSGGLGLSLLPLIPAAVGLTLIAVFIAVVFASMIARSAIAPLVRLTRQAKKVAEGEAGQLIVMDAHDEVAELVGAFNELASQLRQELAAIEEQRAEAEAILGGMGDGVVIVDENHDVITLNRAAEQMLEISVGDARGKTVTEVVRRHEVAELVATGQLPDGPLVVEVGRDRRQVQVVVTPVRVAERSRQLILFQDVTELRRAETIRRDFVANVSHELRTPLASLVALVETLEGGALDDPPAAKEFLDRMHIEVDRLTQMVEELLELARIESGRVQLRFRKADVGRVVREAAERLRPQAERQNLSLVFTPSVEPIEAVIDANRLHQVIINLVHNAVKFTPPGGTIRIGVDWREGQVAISVADTGVGVSQTDLPRLFERFYKTDRSRSSPGTGLGLAIVKHIVQAHSGKVWAESRGRGHGTTFVVLLPSGLGARGRDSGGSRAARTESELAPATLLPPVGSSERT